MRIIGGRWRGLRLVSVGKGDEAAHLRPTSDRVRESLFNLLAGGRFGSPIQDAKVLDLFAGTGALGLEALSRGAAEVTFVESGRAAQKLLSENIRKTAAEGTTILRSDAARMPANSAAPADLVFLDPPYGKTLGTRALTSALCENWLANGALVVWEEEAAQEAPDGFYVLEAKKYGQTWLTFLRVDSPT